MTRQTPAGESQSSVRVSNGSASEQQTPASELQNSEDTQDTQDVSLQAAPIVNIESFSLNQLFSAITPTFDANPGDQEVKINLPFPSVAVSAWVTESLSGKTHFGSAVFKTTSVQLSRDGRQIRVKYRLEYTRAVPALVMVIF